MMLYDGRSLMRRNRGSGQNLRFCGKNCYRNQVSLRSPIGEVVKRLSPEFRNDHPQIQWRKIAGMRDRLVHDYDEVSIDLVWAVIQTNIPELLDYITPLLPTEQMTDDPSNDR